MNAENTSVFAIATEHMTVQVRILLIHVEGNKGAKTAFITTRRTRQIQGFHIQKVVIGLIVAVNVTVWYVVQTN